MTLAGADQAPLLADALHSAPFADVHFVLDTTPGDPAVQTALSEISKDGGSQRIAVKPWVWRDDFSLARNELFAATARLVEEDGGSDGDTWGVVLDSDERLVCQDAVSVRSELLGVVTPTCMVFDTANFYTKERCFRIPTEAYYAGPVHEACLGTGPQQVLRSLRFWELHKNHAQYQAKIARDERLLKRHVKKNPCDPRWRYYLADTWDSMGKKNEALSEFVECGKLKGWDEESAWAYYRAATILLEKARYGEVVEMAAKGLARHAGIAELSWLAAVASFRAGWTDKATYWAQLSVAMGDHVGAAVSKKRILFRKLEALYELPYDVLRFSLPSEEERKEAEREFWRAKQHRFGGPAEEVAVRRDHDGGLRQEARNDLGRLCGSLSGMAKDVSFYPIPSPSQSGYFAMNPSVFVRKGKLEVVIRTVNYTMSDKGEYVAAAADNGVIKTENYLGLVNPKDFTVSKVRKIEDKTGGERFQTQVRGYEDLRPVVVAGRLFGCATVLDRSPSGSCDIAVCELDKNGDVVKDWCQVSGRPEKNWMPVTGLDGPSFLYSVDPTRVVRFDSEAGQCLETSNVTPKLALDHLRGGSQVVSLPKKSGWLVVTHEVVITDDKRRYLHRFVLLDQDFKVKSVSKAWRLRPQVAVEFVAGVVVYKNRLILSAGLDDHEAVFVVLPLEEALRLAGELA